MRQGSERIWDSFSMKLKQFILGRVPDKSTAEDILQEVFLKIHSRIRTLKDEDKIESWVYQITRYAIIDYYRTRKKTSEIDEQKLAFEEEFKDDTHQKFLIGMREIIEDLPPPYSQTIMLTEYEGLTQKDLSKKLGISYSGTKSRVQRARQMLKDALMQCCHFELDSYGRVIDYHEITCCCCFPDQTKRHR